MAEVSVTTSGLLTGKATKFEMKSLSASEKERFEADFTFIVEQLRKIDPEIADDLWDNKDLYLHGATIAKGYFDKPFQGLRPTSGAFGFRPIVAKDFGIGNTWQKSVSAGWNNFWGTSSSPITPSTTLEQRSMFLFHRLISFGPSPKMLAQKWVINEVPYVPFTVEWYVKIEKPHKIIKLIPLPGDGILIHPNGEFYMRAAFEEAGTVEIAALGIVYAEYNYLKDEDNVYA